MKRKKKRNEKINLHKFSMILLAHQKPTSRSQQPYIFAYGNMLSVERVFIFCYLLPAPYLHSRIYIVSLFIEPH